MSRLRRRVERVSQAMQVPDFEEGEFLPVSLAENVAGYHTEPVRGRARWLAHLRYSEQLAPALEELDTAMKEEALQCD